MSADRWGTEADDEKTGPYIPPGGPDALSITNEVRVEGDTAIVTTGGGVEHQVDISDPANPTLTGSTHPCPVPGCEYTAPTKSSLAPHVAAHRRRGDPGTPPPRAYRPRDRSKKGTPPKASKRLMRVTPADVVDGVLDVLYPTSIPTHRVREVAAWIKATERLASEALADQAEPEEKP